MKCKNCGKEINNNYYKGQKKTYQELLELKNEGKKIPDSLLTTYKNFNGILLCENCDEPIEYMDMPIEMFFDWLEYSSEKGDPRKTSGKALIRYFELDKLLEPKNKEGD